MSCVHNLFVSTANYLSFFISSNSLASLCIASFRNTMTRPAEKATDSLREYMIQTRHDTVEEIKDGLRDLIAEFIDDISDKYIIFDKQTGQRVESSNLRLMDYFSDSEWYQHGVIELLKRDEDDALTIMGEMVQDLEDA